jgi:hypothetical protein
MKARQRSPLDAIVRGLGAGAAGTGVMTAWQQYASRWQGSDEDGQGDDAWASAPAPAKVAKRILESLFHRDVPATWIPVLTNVMHWSYGVAMGGVYGLAQDRSRNKPLLHGLAFGAAVWAASYGELVPLGIYDPPWRYPARTLALDASYHLAYGAGVGATFAVLGRAGHHQCD